MVERNSGSRRRANLRSFIGKKAREAALQSDEERDQTPNLKQDGDFANTPFHGGKAFEREEPPKDHMRRYWRQYETTPIVREPINNFARQVIEPGYWVHSENLDEEEHEELYKWLQKAAIIEKEPDKDIRQLLRKAIIQREVRGTSLIEKVYAEEDKESLYGLAFLNAETVRPNSRPGAPMLLLPDDKPGDFDVDGELPKTEDGRTAAYTQYTTASGFTSGDPNDDDVNNFVMDDVIKLTRDADVNEAFGTSRLESCSDTIEGLKQKMRDQNEAIASKAYPLWLFLFGTEEQPWDSDDISRFMSAHEMDDFHPGLKQGVRGDVDIETISGEVADIAEYLEFDINYIMSAMPLPKYALGAFEANINQFVSRTQERNVNRQIKDARREIEDELTEVVQQKAKELFDLTEEEAEEIEFKVGRPGEEFERQDPNQNTINYNGQGNGGNDANDGGSGLPDSVKKMLPPHMRRNYYGHGGPQDGSNGVPDDPSKDTEEPDPNNMSDAASDTVWDVDLPDDGVAELADPRLVSTTDVRGDLANVIAAVMQQFRDRTVQEIQREYADAPLAASMAFEGIANTQLNEAMRQNDLTDSSEVIMREAIQRALDSLAQDNQKVSLDTSFGPTHRQSAAQFARSAQDSTRNAMEELVGRMNKKLQVAANNGESLDRAGDRLQQTFSDDQLRQRAHLIAQMELQSAIESTKLSEYERADDVAGVQVINPCNQNTTPLCRNLAGCGPMDGAVASFDSSKSLAEQWEEQAPERSTFNGFRPLPPVPPFHFGCRSELVPLSPSELEDKRQDKPVTSVADLEAKYGVEVGDD